MTNLDHEIRRDRVAPGAFRDSAGGDGSDAPLLVLGRAHKERIISAGPTGTTVPQLVSTKYPTLHHTQHTRLGAKWRSVSDPHAWDGSIDGARRSGCLKTVTTQDPLWKDVDQPRQDTRPNRLVRHLLARTNTYTYPLQQ